VTRIFTDGSDSRQFRRGIIATVVVLALLCAGFLALDSTQGPKLASASIDTTQVVRQAGQQLRLFANQTIARVTSRDVTIFPATPFTVQSQGQVIAVQFSHRLEYSQRYSVRVAGVTSDVQNQPSTMRYSFTTAPASVYFLDRADPSVPGQTLDRILLTGLRGGTERVVYSARHIQEFSVFPAAIAVVTLNDDDTDSLSLVDIKNSVRVEHIVLPTFGTIQKMRSSPDAGILGFVFSSAGQSAAPAYSSDLMTVDLTAAHVVVPVLGIDSKPLGVLEWTFLSGTASVVAQASDQTVLLIDPKNPKSSTPLGVYSAFEGSSPDGGSIVVADVFSRILYRLSDGKTTRLETHPVGDSKTFGGDLQLLGDGTASVQQVAVLDGGTGQYASYLIYQAGDNTRILFGGKDYRGSIVSYSVSPNGQFVAVDVIPDYATSISDGYHLDPRATSITTVFIDIATGSVVRSVTGFDESW